MRPEAGAGIHATRKAKARKPDLLSKEQSRQRRPITHVALVTDSDRLITLWLFVQFGGPKRYIPHIR